MINSSLVERARSRMDPQTHQLLRFRVRMKPTRRPRMFFLQVSKNVKVTRRKIWAVRRMLKCFPAKSLKLIPHQIDSMGTGVIVQKNSFRQRCEFMARRSTLSHQETNHTSLLSFVCPQSNKKNNCVGLWVFTMYVSYPTEASIDM